MVSAGEASGDTHGASALSALAKLGVQFDSFGMGADKLQAAGMELLVDCRNLSVMGITDVIAKLPLYLLRARQMRNHLRRRKPDLLLLIDYAEFNLYLAGEATRLDIPVLFYISPKIWASRPERIDTIARKVNHMAVLFPFEVPLYEKVGVPVTYVGNPLIEQIKEPDNPAQLRHELASSTVLDTASASEQTTATNMVALIPGSRRGEIRYILPLLLEAARLLELEQPGTRFLLPRAPTVDQELLDPMLEDYAQLDIKVLDGRAHDAMHCCDAAMIASGTATLEAAVIGAPMVVVYAVHWLNYKWMKRKAVIQYFSLVNIVAGKGVVKELIQDDATPRAIADETLRLLQDKSYADQVKAELHRVRSLMGASGASQRLAAIAQAMMQPPSQA